MSASGHGPSTPQDPGPIRVPQSPSAGVDAGWLADGSVVKEQTDPRVYVIYGRAKFWIPSPEELSALGFTWAQVVTVPDGSLAAVSDIPVPGTLLRARDQLPVYYMLAASAPWWFGGGPLWWVPSPDSLTALGAGWPSVHVVPAGSLDAFPKASLLTDPATFAAQTQPGQTSGSLVFPPQGLSNWGTSQTKLFPRLEVPGLTLPTGAHVTEIRGWVFGSAPNGAEDWHLDIELDPEWLDKIGADWTTFVRVGDVLSRGDTAPAIFPDPTDSYGCAAIPRIHCEVVPTPSNMWTKAVTATDWQFPANGVTWPYPLATDSTGQALLQGDYVRVIGSIVTDEPHLSTAPAAAHDWTNGNAYDEANPARATEIHPPDVIRKLDDPGRQEALYAMAVIASAGPLDLSGKDQSCTATLPAPPNPLPGQMVAVREVVGAATNFQTITEGNADLSGALIVPGPDSATVHVKVHGQPFGGPQGRFMATYRVSWQDSPATITLADQSGAPLVRFTGSVHDWSCPVIVPAGWAMQIVADLTLIVTTGDDDLRGGTGPDDNCDAVLQLQTGTAVTFTNINQGAHWNNGETHAVPLAIPPDLAAGTIVGLGLHTQFAGGIGGDNWNVNRVALVAHF